MGPSTFPLFAADLEWASGFRQAVRCAICEVEADSGFEIGSSDELVVDCPACRAKIIVEPDDREAGYCECPSCGAAHEPPALAGVWTGDVGEDEPTAVCLACARRGRIRFATAREWERGLDPAGIDTLLRTPDHSSWQESGWLVCHGPMVYLGPWGTEAFAAVAASKPADAYAAIVDDGDHVRFDELPPRPSPSDPLLVHVFQCRDCSRLRGHLDLA